MVLLEESIQLAVHARFRGLGVVGCGRNSRALPNSERYFYTYANRDGPELEKHILFPSVQRKSEEKGKVGMVHASEVFKAAGGNRHTSAADWESDVLAYGCGNNIAIWNPTDASSNGVQQLLTGHTDVVNAVKLLRQPDSRRAVLISGSADKTVRIWYGDGDSPSAFSRSIALDGHRASINTISILPGCDVFVTGSADATLKAWRIDTTAYDQALNEGAQIGHSNIQSLIKVELVQSISLKPRFFPLATVLARLGDGPLVLAVAGTAAYVQIYVQRAEGFALEATLTGHEGWIRSLEFARESSAADSDYLLSSASQDKYIRLWRFNKGAALPAASAAANDPSLGVLGRSLSNKAHYIGDGEAKHSITFEALLIGHEDWIYTARWSTGSDPSKTPRLLSASADNSLAIWERDEDSGFWNCVTRLGEISAQKGSTTATGSTGGFWNGLWSPDGVTVTSLGRTGSWRVWKYQPQSDIWEQRVGISGHVREAKDIAWAADGSYLLSTGSDQTTRLWAECQQGDSSSWHEISRPQIHGYDLNCIDTLGTNQFISGADEKLLRVFNKPKMVANLVNKLTAFKHESSADLPDAANIPVLGLSNKAIGTIDTDQEAAQAAFNDQTGNRDALDPASTISKSALDLDHVPYEDHLARHTLWPEHEKLYGHGYEISAVAASHDGALVATACRASSIDHAVIRLYETAEWREVRPPLPAHSLTVTSLAFSPDDRYLLSTGRDRQWALFARDETEGAQTTYKPLTANPKGHARMILDCAWAPTGDVFATAGRDKTVKIWHLDGGQATCKATLPTTVPATAVAFYPLSPPATLLVAYGLEDGRIAVATINTNAVGEDFTVGDTYALDKAIMPVQTVNALRWRPNLVQGGEDGVAELAVASDDHAVRIYRFEDVLTGHDCTAPRKGN